MRPYISFLLALTVAACHSHGNNRSYAEAVSHTKLVAINATIVSKQAVTVAGTTSLGSFDPSETRCTKQIGTSGQRITASKKQKLAPTSPPK